VSPFDWKPCDGGYKFYYDGRLEGRLYIGGDDPAFEAYVFVVRNMKRFRTEQEAREWMENVFISKVLFPSDWDWRRFYGRRSDDAVD
jgi:hypothetical protein